MIGKIIDRVKYRDYRFVDKVRGTVKDDILSGMTVSLAMIPEVVAFAFVAVIDPLVALTGAVAVIFVDMISKGHAKGLAMDIPVQNMGFFYLFATVILMGVIQIAAGYFKLGRFVRLIPHPVMLGFVNGLAVVIFFAQLEMFDTGASFSHDKLGWIKGFFSNLTSINPMTIMLGLIAITMLIIYFLPKIAPKLPAALTAILIVTLGVVFIGIDDVATVGSYIRDGGGEGLKGKFPTFNAELWQKLPLNMDTFLFILPYAFLAASVGLIESLMTMNLVDEMTESRGSGNRECIGQGLGNVVSGLFGGTGGCGMIGQTMININAKGRGRLSGVVMSLTLLTFILFADKYIEMVPIAALVGVMFVMVIQTFAWSSFRIMNKIPKADAFILIAVSLITIVVDLAIAVFAGVIIAALVFAWENALRIRARKRVDEKGVKHYEIFGPLFFGSISGFNSKFDVKNDPKEVIIDFAESRVMDQSAIEAINKIASKYMALGKHIHLRHLSEDSRKLIKKAEKICEVNVLEDPNYFVAINDYRKVIEAKKANGEYKLATSGGH